METVVKNVDDLVPYERNPRKNDEAVDEVVKSIKEFGFTNPILVDKNNVIISGHTRWKAAKRLNMKEVPVIVAEELDDDQAQAFRLVDNKTQELATWDQEKLNLELYGIKVDMEQFGFSVEEIQEVELEEEEDGEISILFVKLTPEQKELVDRCCEAVKDQVTETFGNTNKVGNRVYEVLRQWSAQREYQQ